MTRHACTRYLVEGRDSVTYLALGGQVGLVGVAPFRCDCVAEVVVCFGEVL